MKSVVEAWDDVRFYLALTRYRTVRAAAAALGVNHTTVSRRLQRLERSLGSRLVQRTPDGYEPTADGLALLESAEAVEAELGAAARRVAGSDETASGLVRIALTDVMLDVIGPALQTALAAYPKLQLEILVSTQVSDISRRDADIALRFSDDPPGNLIGRKLGRMPVAVYCAASRMRGEERPDLANCPWVRWREPWRQARLETWIDRHYPESRTAVRVDSYGSLERLVRLGAGVGILTPWSASRHTDLVRLSEPVDEIALELWLLMHPDLRGVKRMQVVNRKVSEEVNRLSGL